MEKSDDNNLDKGRIRRQSSGKGQGPGARKEGNEPTEVDGENPTLSTSSPDGYHARSRDRKEKEEEKKAAALFQERDSRCPDERQRSTPEAVRLFPYERTVRVSRKPIVPRRCVGGKRGPIVKFTEDAQRRLRRELHSITGLCQFMILTYPGQFPRRGDEAKQHLQAFCRWVKSFKIGGVWVMEFQQERGAPHFHLLLNDRLDAKAARAKWMEIIGTSALLPSSCALRVEPIYDQHRIRSYVSKKATKEVPCGFTAVGKFYGVFGPVARIPTVDCVSETGLPHLIRALRTLDRKRRERLGWKRRRDSGRWSHSYGKWNNSEMNAIERLIGWANKL